MSDVLPAAGRRVAAVIDSRIERRCQFSIWLYGILRYLSTILLPTLARVNDREQQAILRRPWMEQAVQVQRLVTASVRLIGGNTVPLHKTDGVFELHCRTGDKPEVLTVGSGK